MTPRQTQLMLAAVAAVVDSLAERLPHTTGEALEELVSLALELAETEENITLP
jgi:predicted ATP-dependent protease